MTIIGVFKTFFEYICDTLILKKTAMKKITLMAAIFAVFTLNAQNIFSDDFNAETIDAITYTNWTSIDDDGDGNFWEVFDTADIGTGGSIMTGFGADSDSWEGGNPFTPDNYLITAQPIDLSTSSGTFLSYKVGTYQLNGTFIADKYSIYLTASNDPAVIATETPVATKLVSDDVAADQPDGSTSAAQVTIDISAFDGQVVYLTFRHYDCSDENSVLLDDILVYGVLAVADQSFNNFNYFVNGNNELNLSANTAMESAVLYNVLGQQVISQKLSNTNEIVNISSLNSGIYIAKVTIDGNSKSFKIVKK